MSINVPLIRRSLWRLLSNRAIGELCEKEWIIAPACVTNTRPALYLPGSLDRITASSATSTLELEMRRIKGGRTEHAATIARSLTDAVLCDGYIYKKAGKIAMSIKKEKFFIDAPPPDEKKELAVVACGLTDIQFFGHWMTDGIPLLMAARELGPPVRNSEPLTGHQQEYLSMLNLAYDPFQCGTIDKLIVLEDYGQNEYKKERYRTIRTRLREFGPKTTCPGALLLRGTSGKITPDANGNRRVLVNEHEIATYLQSIGFRLIDSTKHSAREIVENTLGARIIIGVEGSQIPHGLFTMADKGALITILPPFHFNNVLKGQTDCMEMLYAFTVGEVCREGFILPLDTLKKTLDLVAAHQQ
jgi:hypothetical protein